MGKGQITVFIILGIIVLFAFAFMMTISNTDISTESEVNTVMPVLKNYVETCMHDITGENLARSHIEGISDIIDLKLPGCIGKKNIMGVDIFAGKPKTSAVLSEDNDTISLRLIYPFQVGRGDSSGTISKFSVEYPLQQSTSILSDDGLSRYPLSVVSSDGVLKIIMGKGTRAALGQEQLESIGIKMEDKDFISDHYLGFILYDLLPDSAEFEPPLDIVYSYEGMDIPYGQSERKLVLVYINEITGQPTLIDSSVDRIKNEIHAKISHFSYVTACMPRCYDYICGPYDGCGGSCGECNPMTPICDGGIRCSCSGDSCGPGYECFKDNCVRIYGSNEGSNEI